MTRGTRSGEKNSPPPPSCIELEKPGVGCVLRTKASYTPGKLDLTLSLLDAQSRQSVPFRLSMRDEAGTLLIDNREFGSGSARINDLKRGTYELTASCPTGTCVTSIQVQEDTSS